MFVAAKHCNVMMLQHGVLAAATAAGTRDFGMVLNSIIFIINSWAERLSSRACPIEFTVEDQS
jgi:hypothetical protein